MIRTLRPGARRGAVMVLSMIAVGIALTVAATCLISSGTVLGGSFASRDHLQARQIAETAIDAVMRDLERTPAWRENRDPGLWVHEAALYGGSATVEAGFSRPFPDEHTVRNQSFEAVAATLATPLVAPPMSGVIGDWTVSRTALIPTGVTVPDIGMTASASATDGGNAAFVSFGLSVTGTGTFTQELSGSAQPNTVYELSVDVTTTQAIANRSFQLRVYAGGQILASSEHATAFELPSLLGITPDSPATPPELTSVLTGLSFGGMTSAYTLAFTTRNAPPPGVLTIELYAESTGVLDRVEFDNVRFVARSNDPLVLTAVGRYGNAAHRVSASVLEAPTGGFVVREWSEP
jgi:hypothetical protein